MEQFDSNYWALILGGSSGFGLATAKKLSRLGMSICVVHRDRKGAMNHIEEEFAEIKAQHGQFFALNLDALSEEGRARTIAELKERMGEQGRVRLLMHSIAFGNLKPVAPDRSKHAGDDSLTKLATKLQVPREKLTEAVNELFAEGIAPFHTLVEPDYGDRLIDEEDMQLTIYSMGTSLLTWVQDIFRGGLFAGDTRVLGLTSEGNQIAWKGYAAVAAAKVAMESVSRSIAVEFAQYGIRSNILQPGVTLTPALKMIPGNEKMMAVAKLRNPFKRLTRPEDVANLVALLCTDEAAWINGSVLRVDGGEHIASF